MKAFRGGGHTILITRHLVGTLEVLRLTSSDWYCVIPPIPLAMV